MVKNLPVNGCRWLHSIVISHCVEKLPVVSCLNTYLGQVCYKHILKSMGGGDRDINNAPEDPRISGSHLIT